RLRASIYAPQQAVTCEEIAFRDVDVAALAPTLVATGALDGDGDALGRVPRAGEKVVVVEAIGDDGIARFEGCAIVGALGQEEERVSVALEPTVAVEEVVRPSPFVVSLSPDGFGRAEGALPTYRLTDARGAEIRGAALRISVEGLLDEPAIDVFESDAR